MAIYYFDFVKVTYCSNPLNDNVEHALSYTYQTEALNII